jgi:hypothetical protein
LKFVKLKYADATIGTSWKITNPTIQGDAKRRPRSTERCVIRGLLVAPTGEEYRSPESARSPRRVAGDAY